MFFISSIKGNKIGVTDSTDLIEEFYTPQQLDKITDTGVIIEGFEKVDEFYCSETPKAIDVMFDMNDWEDALRLMSSNYRYELVFSSKPRNNGDGTAFISNYSIALYRRDKNYYSYMDENRRYRSDLTYDEIKKALGWYFNSLRLKSIRRIK